MLNNDFFARYTLDVARDLIGKVIRFNNQSHWLAAKIIETEAYYIHDKASHASLGFTEKRKALFMRPGTIYMYYARGGDSLNISCLGDGNAVLIKSAIPYEDTLTDPNMIRIMQANNPLPNQRIRPKEKLCSGQTLLCKSLSIKVREWDKKEFNKEHFYIDDINYKPNEIIQTSRLGIPQGRDEHLPYRFIDQTYIQFCTKTLKNTY